MSNISTNIDFALSNYLLNIIALLLFIISLKIIFAKNLLEAVITMSVFSILITLLYLIMDAPDVAMTESALGACLSTCIYLSFLQNLPEELHKVTKIAINSAKIIPAIIICVSFIVTLIYLGLELPSYGNSNSPLQTHLSKYYIENTAKDIGVSSFVAAILASYRGFDTLGETSVVLIAGISVLLILSKSDELSRTFSMKQAGMSYNNINLTNHPIIRNITVFSLPFIFLYSLYIQINGETSPGGGFQAGAIFASGLIGYNLVYGKTKILFLNNSLIGVAALGVLIYGITGFVSLAFNENYLNYSSFTYFTHDKLSAQTLGIFIIEIGIGLCVSSIMYLIFILFCNEQYNIHE